MVMRFANAIFEPIWNHSYIDHVQITGERDAQRRRPGGYYQTSGALRDMIQNHIFQLMALIAMEPPAALDAVSVRDEKVKVYKSIRPIRPSQVNNCTVRGQYGPASTTTRASRSRRRAGSRPRACRRTR
jgi:glucose-6-phosphate 1-dehydrogenase